MGCQLTTPPHNCWIMSFDDPVQLNRESLSGLCDGDSGRSAYGVLLQSTGLFLKEEVR